MTAVGQTTAIASRRATTSARRVSAPLALAVYEDELELVAASAGELLADHAPAQALRRWMDRFAQRLASAAPEQQAQAGRLMDLVLVGVATPDRLT